MPTPIFLPALQGNFGTWLYYVGLISLRELKDRVRYAQELHDNKKLSDMIQRKLDEPRRKPIADFLLNNKDRFFNSLVVGVHGGHPQWHPFEVKAKNREHIVDEEDQESIGYLELVGSEKLFALDGQHRLSGVRDALEKNPKLGEDRVSVLFVSHREGTAGKQRTRSLFVMLNKHAVPVKKPQIIALDEVDLPAIVTRRLVDEHPWFSRDQIDLERFSTSLPKTDREHLTTLGNLYDVVSIAIRQVMAPQNRKELKQATKERLSEKRIDYYYKQTLQFFDKLGKIDPLLGKYLRSREPAKLLVQARSSSDPNVLFRPAGLLIFAKVLADLRKDFSKEQAFKRVARAPLFLTFDPYDEVIWNSAKKNMIPKGTGLSQRLLTYMLGGRVDHQRLRRDYAAWYEEPVHAIRLPNRLV